MVVKLTEREGATILAALRRWLSNPAERGGDYIATNRGKHKPLDDSQIQRLCKRLSEVSGRGNAASLRRYSNNGARDDQLDPRNRPSTRASGLQRRSRPIRG